MSLDSGDPTPIVATNPPFQYTAAVSILTSHLPGEAKNNHPTIAVVTPRFKALPDGELVIEPDWPRHTKDAEAMLDPKEGFQGILKVIGLLGLVLIAFV